jgi:hypothetical protein
MSDLHPIFQAALAAHSALYERPIEVRRLAYIADLERHDWQYEFSDDHYVWGKGKGERAHLELEREEIDPDYALWNAHCPASFQRRTSMQ